MGYLVLFIRSISVTFNFTKEANGGLSCDISGHVVNGMVIVIKRVFLYFLRHTAATERSLTRRKILNIINTYGLVCNALQSLCT